MRPIHHPAAEEITLAGIFYALGDPARLAIVRNLACGEALSCTAAGPSLDLPKSTLSHHFRILREAGLVRTCKQGVQYANTLRTPEIEARFPGLLRTILALETGGPARKRRRA